MADTAPPPDPRLEGLLALGDLRAWSVIITIFGDAVRPRGGTVAAVTLGRITEPLGIGPATLRVALHRLARDGWITRERRGRHAFYALSAGGLAEFGPATRRIYARAPALAGPWRLAAAPPGAGGTAREALEADMEKAGYLACAPGLFLGHSGSGRAAPGLVEVTGAIGEIPVWMREAFAPAALMDDYAALDRALAALEVRVTAEPPGALDAVVARTLLVHRWRRLLLRHPDLPEAFFPEGWTGEACRTRVLRLHAALSPEADAWLDREIAPAQAAAK